ncbi:hypothetical protein Tco_0040309 [Tanacetum coccineum]
MSSDNASSAVTYTSVSSDSNGPSSWGILLVNADELSEMDPYEEVAQKGQAHPLSPAYVPDLIELDEHIPIYIPEPEHSEYHAPSDDDIQVEDQPYADDASLTAESPGYIADSDSIEEDLDEDSIDYLDEPEDGEEDDERLRWGARKTVRLEPPMSASMEARIAEHAAAYIPPTNPTYDQAPLGHRAAMIRMRDDIPEDDM